MWVNKLPLPNVHGTLHANDSVQIASFNIVAAPDSGLPSGVIDSGESAVSRGIHPNCLNHDAESLEILVKLPVP